MSAINHLQAIKLILNGLAEYMQVNLTAGQLQMYAEDLQDLSAEEIKKIVYEFRKNQKEHYGKFPLPAALRTLIKPEVSSEDVANDVAGKIWDSISRFGSWRGDDAKIYLGELAWQVVLRMGGWSSICTTPSDNRSFFFAQCRDVARSVQNLSLAGKLETKHALPTLDRTGTDEPKSIANILSLVKGRGEGA